MLTRRGFVTRALTALGVVPAAKALGFNPAALLEAPDQPVRLVKYMGRMEITGEALAKIQASKNAFQRHLADLYAEPLLPGLEDAVLEEVLSTDTDYIFETGTL